VKGVVLAGTSSGVGKTVATLPVCRALREAGYDSWPAKAGPDLIGPSHHAAVCDRPSRSLDPWLAGREGCLRNYWRGSGDVCVVGVLARRALGGRQADGLPALCETLTDAEGETCGMADVLLADVRMRDRYWALDHVELTADRSTLVTGATRQAHEFHYSETDVAADATRAFDAERGEGVPGVGTP
jgi:cobyrinic acid a,c-diamide synthase